MRWSKPARLPGGSSCARTGDWREARRRNCRHRLQRIRPWTCAEPAASCRNRIQACARRCRTPARRRGWPFDPPRLAARRGLRPRCGSIRARNPLRQSGMAARALRHQRVAARSIGGVRGARERGRLRHGGELYPRARVSGRARRHRRQPGRRRHARRGATLWPDRACGRSGARHAALHASLWRDQHAACGGADCDAQACAQQPAGNHAGAAYACGTSGGANGGRSIAAV